MSELTLTKKVKELLAKRKEIQNQPLTAFERKMQLDVINKEIVKTRDKLNAINHYREKAKANDFVDSFGGYYAAWWDSKKEHYHVGCTHLSSRTLDVEVKSYKGIDINIRKRFDLSDKKEAKEAKEWLFKIMVECKQAELKTK